MRVEIFPESRYVAGLNTPQKINMEPKNHSIGKDNHLNQASIFVFKMLVDMYTCHGSGLNLYLDVPRS